MFVPLDLYVSTSPTDPYSLPTTYRNSMFAQILPIPLEQMENKNF